MNRPKILVVSDSLTNAEPTNWLAQVQARLPAVDLVAEAHGGWSTNSYFRERLAAEAFRNVPADAELCVILLGSNNLFEAAGGSDAAVAEACAGVVRIIEHVRQLAPRCADVILVAPPTVALKNVDPESRKLTRRIDTHSPRFLAQLGAAYRALAATRGWRFVDLFPVLGDDDFADAAHPNERGQRKLADAIAPTLAAWLEEC